jgi:DNA-binding CsgD family transcriptional regulator/PAS domain-containing protein
MFTEHVPHYGLQTFLSSFSRIVAAEPLLASSPTPAQGERSEELDAALDKLLLSDEAVLERVRAGSSDELENLDVRAFLRITEDGILILDRNLVVQYVSTALRGEFGRGTHVKRGHQLAALVVPQAYGAVESALRSLGEAAAVSGGRRAASVRIPLRRSDASQVLFEASVTAIVAYERVFGYACVLRRISGRERAHEDDGSLPEEVARRWLARQMAAAHGLTPRETEIIELTMTGKSVNGIAERLSVAEVTVKKHRSNAYRKLGVHDRVELLLRADTGG